ncbi:MMPL family transporter [Myxococcota bacterium]|nr:MMPL family transporter [Myxococcota bacterium]
MRGVVRKPRFSVTACAIATAVMLMLATGLGIHTNENDLFSDDLPFFALREDFYASFPELVDPIIVAVDGATVDQASVAARRLTERLREESEIFDSVDQPGGDEFFERHGLLYLETGELEELLENLFTVQPYLSRLTRDVGVAGFFSMLSRASRAGIDGELGNIDLSEIFDRVDGVIRSSLAGTPHPLEWAEVVTGRETERRDRRRFLLIQPVVDFGTLNPAEVAMSKLSEVVEELELTPDSGVHVRATGVLPLSYEEMANMSTQMIWAGIGSFGAVGAILVFGLGSLRLVLASLTTLAVGLAWTGGVAALVVGRLNLISVAFGVLFIGLTIDFAIHLCVRFRDELGAARPANDALIQAAADVGGSLAICALTTAIGFFAFAPTEYAGVAELGIIAGAGMFVGLFTNLTLLPALITLWVPETRVAPPSQSAPGIEGFLAFPVRHARPVLAASGLLTLGALALLPAVHFDANPLRMRDPSTHSVGLMDEMLADGDAFPWSLNVLTDGLESARQLATRIERLPHVSAVVTLEDFVPDAQDTKLEAVEDAAFVLLPTLAPRSAQDAAHRPPGPALAELRLDIAALRAAETSPSLTESVARLDGSLAELETRTQADGWTPQITTQLEEALLGSLPERLRTLRIALTAQRVTLEDLPATVVNRMVGRGGRVRVEIQPAGDLNDPEQLERYVEAVQEIAPDTFGEGLVILETGHAVVRSLEQALITAAVVIAMLLLALWRNFSDMLLVTIPLSLAALFTTSFTVIAQVPFNFANVIVIPLLLGMGVDSGIHLVHRTRRQALPDGNLLRSSTARAVLLSAVTTIASFGALGLSSHLGMASLGQLLTLGVAMILLCNLVVLPSLAWLREDQRTRSPRGEKVE